MGDPFLDRFREILDNSDEDIDRGDLGPIVVEQPKAIELPHHNDLPPQDKGIYIRYSSRCADQHWGTQETIDMVFAVARGWRKYNLSPTPLVGDISAKVFKDTSCHTAHKTGTHVDMDLVGNLPKDPNYGRDNQVKCAGICFLAIEAGAKRVLFSDAFVAKAVNEEAKRKGLAGRLEVRADHDGHFHIEMPLK